MNSTPRAPAAGLVRVLMVDGDPGDHRLISDLLDTVPATRFTVDWASDLAAGRDRLERAQYDVCLIDPALPDGDGLDLLASAEMLAPGVAMIVLTGSASIDRDHQAMKMGASAFLDKNLLDPSTLERVIRYAMHQRTAAVEQADLALRDDVTGLISSALYRDRLDRALAFARRRDRQVAVMMIDLAVDATESVSVELLDRALKEAGRRLVCDLRETDSVARLAERQIGLLIEGMVSLDHVTTVARRTSRLLADPLDVDGGPEIEMIASIGIAVYPDEAGHGDALLSQAEAAMRRAAAEGGRRCRFASKHVDHRARESMVLERAFAAALERRELRLRFHPEIRLETGRKGLAAELLWHHADQGWLPLEKMAASLSDEALIKGIADWALAAAAERVLAWQGEGLNRPHLSLAVPLRHRPALRLLEGAVAKEVTARHVDPSLIELDLHEDLILADARRGFADLTALKMSGIRLALDGFGQGRAGVQDIRSDLLDGLKLAPTLSDQGSNKALTKAFIDLGHALGLPVTAKGARDQRAFASLKRLGCNAVQLAAALPPMNTDAATAWLRATASSPSAKTARRDARAAEIIVPSKRSPAGHRTETSRSKTTD